MTPARARTLLPKLVALARSDADATPSERRTARVRIATLLEEHPTLESYHLELVGGAEPAPVKPRRPRPKPRRQATRVEQPPPQVAILRASVMDWIDDLGDRADDLSEYVDRLIDGGAELGERFRDRPAWLRDE